MGDLIDRQAAIEALKRAEALARAFGYHVVLETVRELPSAEPERKKGHWEPVTNGRGGHQCDRCGCYAPSYQSGTEWLSDFCPMCGADMRQREEKQNER